ncbi:hypothetical protein FOA52_006619 [Chlamydomonas sp. UWO 241]|nr:hypothetical protein FOA52_006619 [Chlamydomonas sp. UWO 241]
MGCLSSKEEGGGSVGHGSGKGHAVEKAEPSPTFGVEGDYKVMQMLGEGGSGQTYLCKAHDGGQTVAIKFIRRPVPKVVLPMLMHEIMIQAELGDGHVNLVAAHAVLVTDTHLGIVMEYASGGNLTEYVTERWDSSEERGGIFLTEEEARYFFRQYIDAVEYLHAHRVAHRDLKLDNIVLDGHSPPWVKVCDFGFAKHWSGAGATMHTQIGTPVYMSPQLIISKETNEGYDGRKADIWACGILLFVMLLGMFPYDHPDHPDPNSSAAHNEVFRQQIRTAWQKCPNVGDMATKLSPQCCDLLDRMFDRDEATRITLAQIKKHPWYNMPVTPELQSALDHVRETQEDIQRHTVTNGATHNEPQRKADLTVLLDIASRDPPRKGQPSAAMRVVSLSTQVHPCHALGTVECPDGRSGNLNVCGGKPGLIGSEASSAAAAAVDNNGVELKLDRDSSGASVVRTD